MRLSVSNIGWQNADDMRVYDRMRTYGFLGLEIAPTRIFPKQPYDRLDEARRWKNQLQERYGFSIPSMQSIWYGRQEKIFGSEQEKNVLIAYTKKAVDFAKAIGCGSLVFGCPKNRCIPKGADKDAAVPFFRELGEYAYKHHTAIALEANPPIYHTNFLNSTEDAIAFAEKVDSKGILLNLDAGTMVENGEKADMLEGKGHLIHHVHISEPGLKPIRKRALHKELASVLRSIGYQRFVSIEVGRQEDLDALFEMMEYVVEVFG